MKSHALLKATIVMHLLLGSLKVSKELPAQPPVIEKATASDVTDQ